MDNELRDLSFEEWMLHIFDHPAEDTPWYWDLDAEWWNEEADPQVTFDYLTRFYRNAGDLLQEYNDAQCNVGLWYLLDNSCSNYSLTMLHNKTIGDGQRIEYFEAMLTVFADVYAQRCSPHLGHLDEPDANVLNNLSCYMWWDIVPYAPRSKSLVEKVRETVDNLLNPFEVTWLSKEVERAVLDVKRRILSIDHVACQESALHGLGHWHYAYPDEVETIVDDFLKQNPNIRPELKQYAQRARSGNVL